MKNRMKEPRGDVKNYRIYTDVFIPDNTHIEVEHPFYSQKSDEVKNIGGKAYMKIYNIKDIFNAKLNKQFDEKALLKKYRDTFWNEYELVAIIKLINIQIRKHGILFLVGGLRMENLKELREKYMKELKLKKGFEQYEEEIKL